MLINNRFKLQRHSGRLGEYYLDMFYRMFVDDAELMEIPYSTASHTPQELDSLEAVAKKMGLLVLRKQQVNISGVPDRTLQHK